MKKAFRLGSSALALTLALAACGQPTQAPGSQVATSPAVKTQGVNGTDIVSGGVYRLINEKSNLALDVDGVSKASGANVQVWTPTGGANQNWLVTDVGSGYATLKAQHSNLCLDAKGGGWQADANVQQYNCNTSAAQQWKIVSVGGGYYKLLNRNASLALDVAGGGTSNGTNVEVYTDNGQYPQHFKFERMDGGSTGGGSTGGGSTTASGVTVYQHSNYGGASQVLTGSSDGKVYGPADLAAVGDNQISSLKVPQGMQAYACDDASQANCKTFGPGDYSYVGDSLNDKISYFEIFGSPTGGSTGGGGTGGGGTGGGSTTGEQAKSAETWAETIGIGTRFDWKVNDGVFGGIKEDLRKIGFRHVRVGLGCECNDWNAYVSTMTSAGKELGLKFALQVEGESRSSLQSKLAGWMNTPSVIYALEGANETFDRRDWWDGEWNNSLDLQKFIKQLADQNGLQSYTWSQGGPIKPYTEWPNGAPYATHANFHAYPWDTSYAGGYFQRKTIPLWQDGSIADGSVATVRRWANDPSKKLAMTEWGYSYGDDGVGPIGDETARAKLIVRNAFEIINAGIDKSYYYSLVDEDNRFGIAEYDGTLRRSGQTLANVFALLRDPGQANYKAGKLDYSLSTASGMSVTDDHKIETDEIHHTLLQKSDGSFWLVLWVDEDSQDGETSSQNVTVNLKTPVSKAETYTPLNGTGVGQTFTGQQFTVSVPDHPLLLKITTK